MLFWVKISKNSDHDIDPRYTATGYETRINFYSGVDSAFDGVPTGNVDNNNADLIAERRFLMAGVGQEAMGCDAWGQF
jgi:hypothetical protein